MAGLLSVSTALFDGYPLSVALEEIGKAGVDLAEPAFIDGYIDFDENAFNERAARSLSSSLSAAGLGVIALSAHHDMGSEKAASYTARRLHFAEQIGARYLITNATSETHLSQWRRNLERVLPICEATGIAIALENPGHGTGSVLPNGARGAELLRSLGSRHLKLNYDIGNVFTYSDETLNLQEDLTAALPYMVHAHLKDVKSDASGWSFVPLGEGTIDFSKIIAILGERAPGVPLGIELPLRLRRPMRRWPERAADPLPLEQLRSALARSVGFARTHWKEVASA